ncbi:lipopolysaccharide biosynthesis protein [Vibrio vulnificus]|nr:lipopolysaccharide biosynthesis protein [Vibrio vulnificus]ELR8704294.1 lipopolysaccharide biosynthesis protein [Vibrio vulnificus]ELR8772538.1 lipopolysaccharide biosynthesis protein [Vibrio vulnificus]
MKNNFNKYLLTLLSGSVVAQALPVAITPVLTRIYTPEDFGVLAIFMAISLTLGSIASGRYELAILLPVKDDDAFVIAKLGILISVILSSSFLVVVFFWGERIAILLGSPSIADWLYLTPVMIISIGLYNCLNYLSTRKELYKNIAYSNITKAVATSSGQLIFSFAKPIFNGLIIGQVIGNIVANVNLFKTVKDNYNYKPTKLTKLIVLLKRYKRFPLVSVWSILANNLSTHLVNIIISSMYSLSTLGYFTFTQKILGLPTSIIGNSIGQVYFQQAAIEKKNKGTAWETYKSTFIKLFCISIVFFLPLLFVIEDLFSFVFGKEWRVAGQYAQILIPFFAVRFVATALSNTNNLFEKQYLALLWQLFLLILNVCVIYLGFVFELEFIDLLYCISMVNFIHYTLLIIITMRVAIGKL